MFLLSPRCSLGRLLLLGLGLLTAARAEPELRSLAPVLAEVEAGDILTLPFRVSERGEERTLYVETLDLPPGWFLVMPAGEFSLPPGTGQTRLLVVQAGPATPAGEYLLRYTVSGVDQPGRRAEAVARVRLRPRGQLQLTPIGAPPARAVAGDLTELGARVANTGNVPLEVVLEARFDAAAVVVFTSDRLRLGPGESAPVRLSLQPAPQLTRLQNRTLRVEARATSGTLDELLVARFHVPLELVPREAGEDPWRRFPVELTTHFGGNDQDRGVQFTLSGQGHLDDARRHGLQFFARAPDRTGRSALGGRDEYWLRYEQPSFAVSAGDRAFSLSELTNQSRYGRGIGVEVTPPDWAWAGGIFYVEDRFLPTSRQDYGGWLAWQPAWLPHAAGRQPSQLRLNLLHLEEGANGRRAAFRETLASLETRLSLRTHDRLEAEWAASRSTQPGRSDDQAWRLAYTGRGGPFSSYRLQARRAGPGYAGRQADTADYGVGFTMPLHARLNGQLDVQRYERNLAAAPNRGPANRENLYRGGLDLRFSNGWSSFFRYQLYDRDDALPTTGRRLLEQGPSLGVSRVRGALSTRAEVRYSQAENRLTGDTFSGTTATLSGSYRFSSTLQFTGTARIGRDGAPNDSRLLREGRDYGGTLRWRPTPRLTVNGSYHNYTQRFPDQPLRERAERDHYSAGADFRLTPRQHLRADVRRTESRFGTTQTSYFLSYVLRLNPPVALRRDVGALEGWVRQTGRPGSPGVADAIVYVDGTATRTDADGRFRFRTLAPGDYTVRVDTEALGLDVLPGPGGLPTVTVTGAQTATTEVSLTRGASLRGQIFIAPPENGNGNGNGNGYSNGNGNGNGPANGPGTALVGDRVRLNGNGYSSANGHGHGNGNGNANGHGANRLYGDGVLAGNGHGSHRASGNGVVNGRNGTNGNGRPGANGNGTNGANGLGNLLVELSNGEQTLRTVSDRAGGFLFQQVLPGEWTLRVYPHNLPAHHRLETPTRPLHLRAGEEGWVEVRVLPQPRTIRMLDEGRLSSHP